MEFVVLYIPDKDRMGEGDFDMCFRSEIRRRKREKLIFINH